jgi:hypothetical protein
MTSGPLEGVITNLGAYQDSKHLHFHVVSGEALRQAGA